MVKRDMTKMTRNTQMKNDGKNTPNYRKVAMAALLGCAALGGTAAHAQISRSFIGPHEYSLPDPNGMKPWNVFVQYATGQQTNDVWNGSGDKKGTNGDTEQIVGLSKYVHFWSLSDQVGMAWEVILPEVSVHNSKQDISVSGIGDVITGPAFWMRPNQNWTLGTDMFFVQIPVGDEDLRTTRWNVIAAVWWDAQYGKFNYTGNIGTTIPGPVEHRGMDRPGEQWYSNNRFGYRATELLEPFLGLDYEWQESNDNLKSNHEFAGVAGLMFHLAPTYHLTMSYSGGFAGENRSVSNNINVRFAYVF